MQYKEVEFNHTEWAYRFMTASKNHEGFHELRAEIFKGTMEYVKAGAYILHGRHVAIPNEGVQEKAEFFTAPPVLTQTETAAQTRFAVISGDCLDTAYILTKTGRAPCVLNMASGRNPGGGVIGGAGAQEENLFRRSNLFLSLYQFAPYANDYKDYGITKSANQYPLDRKSGGIYSSGVTVFRDSERTGYQLLADPFQAAFATVPAINRPSLDLTDGKYFISKPLIEPAKEKIRTVLRIAGRHQHDCLILGAWGCGAFCNPPEHIALLLRAVFDEAEFRNRFSLVVFAIIDDHNARKEHNPEGNFLPFKRVFEPVYGNSRPIQKSDNEKG